MRYSRISVGKSASDNRITYYYEITQGSSDLISISLPLLANSTHVDFIGDGFWFGTFYLVPVDYDVDARALLCKMVIGKEASADEQ